MARWLDPRPEQQIWWVADREFMGQEWLEALTSRRMHFCMRLRKSALVVGAGKKAVKIYQLFESSRLRVLTKARRVQGCRLYLAGQKLTNGDYFIVGSATKTKRLATIYAQRWQVETLFAAFKSRGFNLEECRVNNGKRIKTLLFILAMAATWAVKAGQWLIQQGKKIPLKTFQNQVYQRWKSVFRWGLDYLQTLTLNNLAYHPMINLCPV